MQKAFYNIESPLQPLFDGEADSLCRQAQAGDVVRIFSVDNHYVPPGTQNHQEVFMIAWQGPHVNVSGRTQVLFRHDDKVALNHVPADVTNQLGIDGVDWAYVVLQDQSPGELFLNFPEHPNLAHVPLSVFSDSTVTLTVVSVSEDDEFAALNQGC